MLNLMVKSIETNGYFCPLFTTAVNVGWDVSIFIYYRGCKTFWNKSNTGHSVREVHFWTPSTARERLQILFSSTSGVIHM